MREQEKTPLRHFMEYDPLDTYESKQADADLGHYDDYDVDGGLGPYRPLYPWREVTTICLACVGVAYAIWWIIAKIF